MTLPANFHPAQLPANDPLAGAKHHGSEGRIGPAAHSPECQTSLSEPTRNQLQALTLTLPANFHPAQLRAKDPLAGPKHHGSEGRIGPADRSPDCQTSLSEPTIETSSKPWLCLPTFTLHSSGPRTPSQGQNTMAGPECQTSLSEPTRTFGKALTLPANLQFLNYLETSFKHSKTFHSLAFPALPAANLPASSCSWLGSCTAPVKGPSQGPNAIAVKDGSGPRATARSS